MSMLRYKGVPNGYREERRRICEESISRVFLRKCKCKNKKNGGLYTMYRIEGVFVTDGLKVRICKGLQIR